MSPPVAADEVRISIAAEEDFLHRHRKDGTRARNAMASLEGKRDALLADTAFGPVFQPPKVPSFLREFPVLRVIKGLPHGFRAVYSVIRDPAVGLVVQIEWLGDHSEYDRLFGYKAS
jgi:hypothetical protein